MAEATDTILLVQGDYGHGLEMTLTYPDTQEPINVAAATVRLFFRKRGADALTATIVADKPNGGGDGAVRFVWPQGALDDPGRYEGEVEIETTTPAMKHTGYQTLKFRVRPEIEI